LGFLRGSTRFDSRTTVLVALTERTIIRCGKGSVYFFHANVYLTKSQIWHAALTYAMLPTVRCSRSLFSNDLPRDSVDAGESNRAVVSHADRRISAAGVSW
jgi:hypothetical protein